ncbi:hypothetical protein D8S78_03935 [Natrialba swarupiae]|nr:hypothetical protein [Natrialba swarupiae]
MGRFVGDLVGILRIGSLTEDDFSPNSETSPASHVPSSTSTVRSSGSETELVFSRLNIVESAPSRNHVDSRRWTSSSSP